MAEERSRHRAAVVGASAILFFSAACSPADAPPPSPPPAASLAPAPPPSANASPPPPAPATSLATPTQPPGPPVAPTPGGTTARFSSARAELGPIVWAREVDPTSKAPRAAVQSFSGGSPMLHAAVPVARLARGTSLSASWSYNGTPLPLPPTQVIAERDERDAWVEFHLAQASGEPWPSGVYAVAVLVDGQPAQSAAVLVVDDP